jgi:hypothetical protein
MRDKQLKGIKLQAVRLKRDSDQALNIKEFAVLAGISYSVAREWFHATGFPAVQGMVFWGDFVLWRRALNSKNTSPISVSGENSITSPAEFKSNLAKPGQQWPIRAAMILAGSK